MNNTDYKIFKNNTFVSINNIFIWIVFIIFIMWLILIFAGPKSILNILYMFLITLVFIYIFSRISEKIQFESRDCIIYSPPFLKQKYKLKNLTIIIKHETLVFLSFNNNIFKFYVLILDNKELKDFIQYIKNRKNKEYHIKM